MVDQDESGSGLLRRPFFKRLSFCQWNFSLAQQPWHILTIFGSAWLGGKLFWTEKIRSRTLLDARRRLCCIKLMAMKIQQVENNVGSPIWNIFKKFLKSIFSPHTSTGADQQLYSNLHFYKYLSAMTPTNSNWHQEIKMDQLSLTSIDEIYWVVSDFYGCLRLNNDSKNPRVAFHIPEQ